jgi:hypothetical protein
MRQIHLHSRHERRNLLQARRLNIILIRIHLQPQLPALRIHHPPHPIRAPQRLMQFQPMPGIAGNTIIPPNAELRDPRILRFERESGDLLEGELLLVPFDADVVYGLLGQVLEHLGAEGVDDFVLHVEVPRKLADDVYGVVVFDVVVFELQLFFSEREDAVFGDVIAVSVGGLGPLRHGDHLLLWELEGHGGDLGVWTFVLLFDKAWYVVPISLQRVGDFVRCLRRSKLQNRVVVHGPVLRLFIFAPELLAFNAENLDTDTTRCGDVVRNELGCEGRVPHDAVVRAGLGEHALSQVLGEVVVDGEFADYALLS